MVHWTGAEVPSVRLLRSEIVAFDGKMPAQEVVSSELAKSLHKKK
jgi:hypothetical protein